MQQTNKYQFNLVEGSDDFSPTPLNQNMEKVEEKLSCLDAAVETAQTTADAAQSAASAVQGAYTPGNKPYIKGSYVGTGAEMAITLGFRPSFLILSGMGDTLQSNSTAEWDRFFGLTAGNAIPHRVSLTDTGFVVYPRDSTHYLYPDFTENGKTYDYIAFR